VIRMLCFRAACSEDATDPPLAIRPVALAIEACVVISYIHTVEERSARMIP
jgi:hypothetical protein